MKGDFHVRFRENVRVKFPRVTRLGASKIMEFTLDRINRTLNLLFKDLSISTINYSIDTWTLEFCRYYDDSHYSTSHVSGLSLVTHDIEVSNETEWIDHTQKGPFNITDSIDYQESIKALILFHLARLPIQGVELKEDADLYFRYANDKYFKVKGHDEIADWIWWLNIENHENVIINDSGRLVFQTALKKYIKAST
ncbi:hypothetical protein D770_05040 [Flammeovirgaceae bacterium 311]|nr:hypothetical protein D770_05040 [Flammeovirgaceae bacterium 311]